MPSIKLALRSLARTPFVAVIAVLSLALGVGANAGVFSAFDQILLRPLPVRDPGRLVNLSAPGPKPGSQSCNLSGNCAAVFSYPMFRDLERVQTVFTGIAAHRRLGVNLSFRRQTLNADGSLVSGSYFPMLGLQPTLGRLLGPEDDRTIGEPAVAVLSYDFWRTHFNADAGVLNETLIISGQPMTIIGVAPRGFEGTTLGGRAQVFMPITMYARLRPGSTRFENRRSYWAYLFARLEPGVSIEQARTALNAQYHSIVNDVEVPLQEGMSDDTMARFKNKEVLVEPGARGQSALHRKVRAPVILLFCVTGLVVLIACSNIANLLLARGASRAGEMAIRLSIGAGRGQLVSQLLTESCVLAVLGGATGLLMAGWTMSWVGSFLPAGAARSFVLMLDGRVVLFTAVLSMATGLAFGLFPALHCTNPNLIGSLKNQAGQPSGNRAAARFRSSLVVSQVALSLALLFAAGIFIRSLANVSRIDLGIETERLVTFRVSPGLNGYGPTRSMDTYDRIQSELAAAPGVSAVATADIPLLTDSSEATNVSVDRFQAGPDADTSSGYNAVSPEFFGTMGIRLLAGREFGRGDVSSTPKVAIVNEAFAKKFNLGQDPVGRRMAVGNNRSDLDIEIVGLVKNAKFGRAKEADPPQYFIPHRQDTSTSSRYFYVRTGLDSTQGLGLVPRLVARVDPNLPVQELITMQDQVRENVFMDRMIGVLSAAFAGLATLLAAIGLYGVLAYAVTQRTREIGLRMALGASPRTVRGMVFSQVARLVGVGVGIGLAAAAGLGIGARSLLFEIQAYDPVAAIGAAAVLGSVALAAGLIPAVRASRIDPIQALRDE
jgi:predicted permease